MARTGRPRSFDDTNIIERSREIFWRRGYAGTSMRELKDGLGVLPGSLYSAFGDKHAIFLRALESYAQDARQAAESLVQTGGSELAGVRRMLLDALDGAQSMPGMGCMLGNTAAELLPDDKDAGRVVKRAFGDLESGIQDALLRAQRAGEVRADVDCGAHARLLLALLQGLHVVARAERNPHRLDDAIDAALEAITVSPAAAPARRRKR